MQQPQSEKELIQGALTRLRSTQAFTPEMLGAIEWEMKRVFEWAQHLQRQEFYRAEAKARGVLGLHG